LLFFPPRNNSIFLDMTFRSNGNEKLEVDSDKRSLMPKAYRSCNPPIK
jgi:hypothetical protein